MFAWFCRGWPLVARIHPVWKFALIVRLSHWLPTCVLNADIIHTGFVFQFILTLIANYCTWLTDIVIQTQNLIHCLCSVRDIWLASKHCMATVSIPFCNQCWFAEFYYHLGICIQSTSDSIICLQL